MKINLKKRDIIWSYIGTMISLGANFIMLPFIIFFLDEDMLGLWYVFSSVGAIVTLFDFGFSVTFARNITYCWSGAESLKKENVVFASNSETNYYLMKQVIKTCKIVYGILSAIALTFLISIGTIYIKYVSREIVSSVPIISWTIYCMAIFLNLYYGYYSSFLRGVGAVEQANKNSVYAKMVQILFTIILLILGMGIIGASLAYLSYGIVFRLLGKKHFYNYKGIGRQLSQVDEGVSHDQIKNMFIIVWHNAWRDGIISMSNYCCNQITTIICSMYLSLGETGVYSMGVQIASAIAQIAGTLYNTYQPELQSAYVSSNMEKMRKTMSIIVTSYIYIYLLGSIGVIVIGIPILKIVKPTAIVSMPVLVGLLIYQFMLKFRNCYTSYFSCTNRIMYVNGFVFSAVVCVILSFVLIGPVQLDVWGLILAQIISQGIYNLWYWPIKAHKEIRLSFKDMLKLGTYESIQLYKNMLRRNK
ncbi:MAG: hypothetical protein IKY94_13420 [Lachnospiraceae bacterium]|nr:hypothetical protein [Lachnospiraceae bacterium]